MTTNLRQAAIKHVAHTYTLPDVPIEISLTQDKRPGLAARVLQTTAFRRLLQTAERLAEFFATGIWTIVGLALGLALMGVITGIAWMATYCLLEPDLGQGIIPLIFHQSLHNFVGFLIGSLSLLVWPYLCFGIAVALPLVSASKILRRFQDVRTSMDLALLDNNDDPVLLQRLTRRRVPEERGAISYVVERIVAWIGAFLGTVTGSMAGLGLIVIEIKFAVFLITAPGQFGIHPANDASTWMLIISLSFPGVMLALSAIRLAYQFLRAALTGRAVAALVKYLFDGDPYRIALAKARQDFENIIAP